MQKLALKENFIILKKELLSEQIMTIARELEKKTHQNIYQDNKHSFIQLINESKTKFENILLRNGDIKEICNSLNTLSYDQINIAELIIHISNTNSENRNNLKSSIPFKNFLNFHQSIINISKMLSAIITESLENPNVIIFTLVSKENPTMKVLIEALSILEDVIDFVKSIFEDKSENKIYILDKGSNTKIGIEASANTITAILEVFKVLGDLVFQNKYDQQKIIHSTFLDQTEILIRISEMEKSKIYTPEEALHYKTVFKFNINKLLALNTFPSQFLEKEYQSTYGQLLLEHNEKRVLKQGDVEPKSE